MIPSWGVLAKASRERLEAALRLMQHYALEHFVFRTCGGWTAAFYMEPSPTGETEAVEALRRAGIEAAHLNFDRDTFRVHRWDGHSWSWTGEDPIDVCGEVGLAVPGHSLPREKSQPFRPTRARSVSLVEGMTADEVYEALGDSDVPDTVEDTTRGALVTKHPMWVDGPTYPGLSERVPARVYHLDYDPLDGRLVCLSVRHGVVEQFFEIGNTWERQRGEVVDNIEGESTPQGIARKLGVPDSFFQ